MLKRENIVSYSEKELDDMLARGEDRTNVERVKALTEDELEASIDVEEEGVPLWDTAAVHVPEPKQQLTVRFDGDIIDWFKAQGPGYQTRMNAVLRSFVDAKKREELRKAAVKG